MHGVVFSVLNDYVVTNHGSEGWEAILDEADLGSHSYLALKTYPDEELFAIVDAATTITGAEQSDLLADFGQFAAPHLVEKYDAFLDDDWGAFDILEHTEDAMHKAVRLKEDGASPPELECDRVNDDEVVITYTSDHQLCSLGEGLINGIADYYDSAVTVSHDQCMLENDSKCKFHVEE